jgi:hypothetical protein
MVARIERQAVSAVAGAEEDFLWFWCDPCDTHHRVPVTGPHKWEWNGSLEAPTLAPSIRVSYDFGPEHTPKVCHSVVTDGQIAYCGDCTHALAGQTVPMAVLP